MDLRHPGTRARDRRPHYFDQGFRAKPPPMKGHIIVRLSADRLHRSARVEVRSLLLQVGFVAGGPGLVERSLSLAELDGIHAMLCHLQRRHKGVKIHAVYTTELNLNP